jgi:glucokinase
MTLRLAGDIGGTKTILSLVEVQTEAGQEQPIFKICYEVRYTSRDFFDLVPMVHKFLEAAAHQLGETLHPEAACFAIAGPVVNNTSQLTNLSWHLEAERLARDLAIARVSLINDFAAVGYGVLGLSAADLQPLQAGKPQPDAPIAVIGAGTGLGEGFLIRQTTGYQVYASEGGHTDFAPRNDLEFQLLKYLLGRYHLQRVSVERVVSGQGIVAIYQFLRDCFDPNLSPTEPTSAVEQIVRTWEHEAAQEEKSVDPAAAIAQAALAQTDPLSVKTMQIFIEAYGAEAGNLALKFLPLGGLYLAGGIATKNLPLFLEGSFMQAFTAKGRMSNLMQQIPIQVILNPRVGLLGAALYADRLFST